MKPRGDFSSGVAVGVLATLAGTELLGQTLAIGCVAALLTLACVAGFVRTWRELPHVSAATHDPTDAPEMRVNRRNAASEGGA